MIVETIQKVIQTGSMPTPRESNESKAEVDTKNIYSNLFNFLVV